MKSALLRAVALWLAPLAAFAAQPAGAPAQPAPAPAAAASAPESSAATAPHEAPGIDAPRREPIEPNVQHIVIEGDNTRVEELRVRGQTQSVVVTTKGGARYEMVVGDNSRDLSDGGMQKGAAGQRVWRLLSF